MANPLYAPTLPIQQGSIMSQVWPHAGGARELHRNAASLDVGDGMNHTEAMDARGFTSWLWGPWSRLGLSTALVAFAVDQANKLWMLGVYRIQDRGQVRVAPFLDLVFVRNTGISYNIGSDALSPWMLAGFAAVTSLVMAVWIARAATGPLMALSVGLIIGGAIGNAIDRLWLGGVADFYLLHAFGYSWYVFNIADVAIVAGVIGLLYDSVATSRPGAANAPH